MQDRDAFWGELESLGVDVVRERVALAAWLPPFDGIAAAWLELQDTRSADALSGRSESRAEMALRLASEANSIAAQARSDARNAWIMAAITIAWTVITSIWPLNGILKMVKIW